MDKLKIAFILVIFASTLGLSSCTPVKGYQKMYLNDTAMQMAPHKLNYFETNFHTYREGASGANGGKVGGGCGCN